MIATWLAMCLTATSVWLLVRGHPPRPLRERLADYLATEAESRAPKGSVNRLEKADLTWNREELALRSALAAAGGAMVGILLAQTDSVAGGSGRSVLGLATAGAVAGVLAVRSWISTRIERRSRTLFEELPSVTDGIALQMMAGESVSSALELFVEDGHGVAAAELKTALRAYREGQELGEALVAASVRTVHPEAGRLYQQLGHAHHTGGRQADILARLAADYRAAAAREITAEGGRRALAVYGPILALMIPVTLLFLMYPTLVGLRQLATGP